MFSLFSLLKQEIKPYNSGYLPELDGHQIHYMEIGNPNGKIVLSFHGGPGGRSNPQRADIFDLKKYRVIMFDQRGCGQTISKDLLYKNTIQQTVYDAKRVLDFLEIQEQVVIHGCSFGTACALLFASQYKDKVASIVLLSVFLGNTEYVHMFDEVCALFYPEIKPLFFKISQGENTIDYFYQCAISNDEQKQKIALQYYGAIEHLMGSTKCTFPEIEEINQWKLNSFRVYMHYIQNKMFLQENELLDIANTLENIPVYIFHNRLDMVCPVVNAYVLSKKIPQAHLRIVEDCGHISKKMFDCAQTTLTAM